MPIEINGHLLRVPISVHRPQGELRLGHIKVGLHHLLDGHNQTAVGCCLKVDVEQFATEPPLQLSHIDKVPSKRRHAVIAPSARSPLVTEPTFAEAVGRLLKSIEDGLVVGVNRHRGGSLVPIGCPHDQD